MNKCKIMRESYGINTYVYSAADVPSIFLLLSNIIILKDLLNSTLPTFFFFFGAVDW